jgi:uncharacterized protein YkwD
MSVTAPSIRRVAALVAAVTTFFALLVVAGPLSRTAQAATYTPPSGVSRFDAKLLHLINRARENRGLHRLILTAGTTDVAHTWSCRLASSSILSHNGNLGSQLETHGSYNWTTYAENVGYVMAGTGARGLFRAYMHSPGHRANILDRDARFIGIWSKKGGGFRWNTLDFVGSTASAYNDSYGASRATC